MDEEKYIKALSVRNVAEMVYALQVFHEPGMLPGMHLRRMYDSVEVIPDKGWVVWYDRGEPLYDTMTDEEFRNAFVTYDNLPADKRPICDAHPSYDEWLEIMDRKFEAGEAAKVASC